MRFEVVHNSSRTPAQAREVVYLLEDNWNDWFKYQTLYVLTYFDGSGNKHELGGIKIGQFGMTGQPSRPAIPQVFERFDERFFSVGQDEQYYRTLMALPLATRAEVLIALRDLAADEDLCVRALDEKVTRDSLLRHVSIRTIEGQYRRILAGGVPLTPYRFRYTGPTPKAAGVERLRVDFLVNPDSRPPTNIHVLIGRNGVGKTFLLKGMTRALVQSGDIDSDGEFTTIGDSWTPDSPNSPFSNILSITFSAFDDFEILRSQSRSGAREVRYVNVGLRKRVKTKNDEWAVITLDPEELAKDFSDSAKACSRGVRSQRWRAALSTLEADPLFAEAEVAGLADVDDTRFGHAANALYRRLSSGHKIVLLTITKLVEHAEEKTLVLMDEPEAHLHPPLLSAFIRALSDLLINRNGVAIIATHSPVVLQEVPRSCVWKIVRHGSAAEATRPAIETFAENVGTLTREVFGLEVTRSGFHQMLADAINDEQLVDQVAAKFDNEIGSEGRALISSMLVPGNTTGNT